MLAIYTRLSREDDDSNSIENQLREAKEFAKKHNFEKFKIYDEGEGISGGAKLFERPQLSQLMKDMQNGEIKAVHARKQERLERNLVTWGRFLEVVFDNKIKVYYSGVLQDLETPEGKMLANIMSSFNTYTIDKQSHLTKKALLDNVKQGKAHSVKAYGYKTDADRYLKINGTEAEVIKRIFKDHIKGLGCNTIAEHLNAEGVPTRYSKLKNKTSGKWHDKTVRDILRNTLYYGKRKWGGKMYDAPAIITKKLFDESIKAFENNQNGRGKKVEHKYLLNGLIKCGVCGRNMYGRRKLDGNDNAYTCAGKRKKGNEKCSNRSINIDAMEEFVWNRFFVEQRFIELVTEAVEATQDKCKQTKLSDQIESLNKQIDELSKDKKNAIRLAIKGLIDESDIETELKIIDSKINGFQISLSKIEEELNFINLAVTKQKLIKSETKGLKKNTPFNTKREIIHKYLAEIHVKSDKLNHAIWINFDLPIKEETYYKFRRNFFSLNDLPDNVKEIINFEGINYFN